MKISISSISLNFILHVLILAATSSFALAGDWSVPSHLVGTWSAQQKVTVRMVDQKGDYIFISDTVLISITIKADRTVEGTCGRATFLECRVAENRGWFGRYFNLATDYVITGKLIGKVFENDSLNDKTISIPFNAAETSTDGSLFQKLRWFDLYPMADFALRKQ